MSIVLAGGCCGFLFSSAVPIAMIVVGACLSCFNNKVMSILMLKVGAQYNIEDDDCVATRCSLTSTYLYILNTFIIFYLNEKYHLNNQNRP